MLSRGGASGGVFGSSNAPCAENRAAPERAEFEAADQHGLVGIILGK